MEKKEVMNVVQKKKPQQTSNRKKIKRFKKMHATRIQN